jgi:hypothetical protein
LYRVPGNQAQVLDEKALRKPEKIDFDRLHLPVHAVATALKKFLDLLPDALIPASGHEPILQAAAEEMEDSVGNPNGFKQTVHEHVPSLNRRVLHYLLTHLRRVAENVETNAMDAKNLAKVWSPTVQFSATFYIKMIAKF